MTESDPRVEPDTLSGWKEIATWLGKSERSAQRWEAKLGLPVRRFTTPDGGQIVSASRREIDEWRRSRVGLSISDPEESTEPESRQEPALQDARRHTWRHVLSTVRPIVVGIALFACGTLFGAWILRPAAVASSVEFVGRHLQGLDQRGAVVWSYEFDRDVTGGSLSPPALLDLDGDEQAEWIVPVVSTNRGIASSDAVFCFTNSGALKWSVRPDQKLTYPSRTITAPWMLTGYAVSPGIPRRVWASFRAQGGGYSFITEISPGGSSSLRFVHRGPISSIHHWDTLSGGILVAGGFSAEHTRPAVVLITENEQPSGFPSEDPARKSCAECPNRGPSRVYLFARSELETPSSPHTIVRNLGLSGTDLQVMTRVGSVQTAIVTLKPDLSVASFNLTPSNWRLHKELESQGRLDHTEENCPDRRVSNTFREWTPASGWQDRQIRP